MATDTVTRAGTRPAPDGARAGLNVGWRRPRPVWTVWVVVACAVVCVAMAALSLIVGSKPVHPGAVIDAITGGGSDFVDAILASRIRRTSAGAIVGVCLAVAGVIMQGITRNPLGDPGLLGVNIGASTSIVTATAFVGAAGATQMAWLALPGAFIAMLVVYVVGSGRGGGPVRLVLAGAVVTAVLTAYIQAVTLSLPDVFDNYRFWVVGSLAGRTYDAMVAVLPFAVAGLLLAVLLSSALNSLALGDLAATALGARVPLVRLGGIVSATLLCAAATALAGPIIFVGLAVPHIARALVGGDHRRQLPVACLLGPCLILGADIIGRLVAQPQELMVGVVVAFAGAPFLLFAVRRLRQ